MNGFCLNSDKDNIKRNNYDIHNAENLTVSIFSSTKRFLEKFQARFENCSKLMSRKYEQNNKKKVFGKETS